MTSKFSIDQDECYSVREWIYVIARKVPLAEICESNLHRIYLRWEISSTLNQKKYWTFPLFRGVGRHKYLINCSNQEFIQYLCDFKINFEKRLIERKSFVQQVGAGRSINDLQDFLDFEVQDYSTPYEALGIALQKYTQWQERSEAHILNEDYDSIKNLLALIKE